MVAAGEGKIERTIRERLISHPDEAYTTDELCTVCYGVGSMGAVGDIHPIERKHRVAVLRAINKVLVTLPDWRSRRAPLSRGNTLVFFDASSVLSTAKAAVKPDRWGRDTGEYPAQLAAAERAVAEHSIMRHGTNEQRQQLADRRAADQQFRLAKLSYAAAIAKNPLGVLISSGRMASENISELAEKVRRLIHENDLDAIRDELAAIAIALDDIAREAKDPMATIREQLDASRLRH